MSKEREKFEEQLVREIRRKEIRKSRGQSDKKRRSFWLGLSMFGLIGWSVVIPTLALTGLGIWLDGIDKGQISWTLTGLVVGVVIGCLNAWYWIKREGYNGD